MAKPFCMAPWVASHVTATGHRSLCCVARKMYDHVSLEDWWNSPEIRATRLTMLDGKAPEVECDACSVDKFRSPQADVFNAKYADLREIAESLTAADGSIEIKPVEYEVKHLLCNLKCRHCGPSSSSSLASEAKLRGISIITSPAADVETPDDIAYMVKYANRVDWAGGEPFMSPIIERVLQQLIDAGRVDVNHGISTNLMYPNVKKRDRIFALLKPFPGVHINASIDGMGEIGEFCRVGWKDATFRENFALTKAALPDKSFSIIYTLSSMSLFGLTEVIQFCADQYMDVPNLQMIAGHSHHYMHHDWIKLQAYNDQFDRALAVDMSPGLREKVEQFRTFVMSKITPRPMPKQASELLSQECEFRGGVGVFERITAGMLN